MSVGEQLVTTRPRDRELDLGGALRRLRGWAAPRQGALGLAGVMACALIVAVSADQTAVLLPQSVGLALPKSLSGGFGAHGVDLGYGGVGVIFAAMFFCYLAAVTASRQLSARVVLVCVLALEAIVLLGPPLISTDVFSYIAYGRLGSLYHINPYLYGPSANPLDPIYPLIGEQWVHTPTAYGPLFTAISYLLTPLDVATGVLAYRAIATVSALVVIGATWQAAKLREADRVKALILVGCNPILLVYGVAGGHNDLLMMALIAIAVLALLYRQERTGALMIVLATAVKITAALLAPFALAREGAGAGADATRRRRTLLGAMVLLSAAVAGLTVAMFGTGPLHLPGTLQTIQRQGGVHSVPGLLLTVLQARALLGPLGIVLDIVAVAAIARLLLRVWRGEMDWIAAAGWATVVLLLCTELLLPWYVAWLLPLAAIARDRRLVAASLMLTALCLTTV
jgi:alpha-1,6-mannosyltransferase